MTVELNGTTAEVLNTDAEGRLVLGDALCLASELEPDCIIDLATLTGACLVALGSRVAGVLGTDKKLVNALIHHGKDNGEAFWELPLVEEYNDDIRSMNADIQNIGAGYGGTITAALFLKRFVCINFCFVYHIIWNEVNCVTPAIVSIIIKIHKVKLIPN